MCGADMHVPLEGEEFYGLTVHGIVCRKIQYAHLSLVDLVGAAGAALFRLYLLEHEYELRPLPPQAEDSACRESQAWIRSHSCSLRYSVSVRRANYSFLGYRRHPKTRIPLA